MTERRVDAAGAIGATALAVDPPHLLGQPGVRERTVGRRALLPGMEPRAGDAEHTAERLDGVAGLLRSDEPVDRYRLSLSRAKKAAAFFKMSRSSRNTLTSRPRRRSSSRPSPERPARPPPPIAPCFTH